ncbi:hypothetical protein AB0E10_12310 [Streptomyces sp. NPDC048045]|uniref:hypothetical protein n=1 Tax=Streptomyces sp. NPDC048045 TaxID=3154710 RepID=UPI00342BE29E
MRRWMKAALAVAATLALGGWFAAPYVKDWWLVRTACDGALPAGAVRQLAAPGGHLTTADAASHKRLGDYRCSLRFQGNGDGTLVVRMDAYTRRDDQDGVFLDAFPQAGFSAQRPLAEGLPGFMDDFGDLQFLLRCPDLGRDAEGRQRKLLASVALGRASAYTTHAAYEAAVALVNSASDRLGCGAQPLVVPKGGIAPPDSEQRPAAIPVTRAGDTACGWATRARVPHAERWSVAVLMNNKAPTGRCDLTTGTDASWKTLRFAAWYGDWSNRLVTTDGVLRSLTATSRCDGEAAHFAVDASDGIGIGKAEQRRLLKSFAEDQVERRGCSGLRLTG